MKVTEHPGDTPALYFYLSLLISLGSTLRFSSGEVFYL